jgi:flagellar basal-body rod protein FlgF
VPDVPAEPVVDFVGTGVVQGYIENANVNPVLEMTRLISVTRAFEAMTAAADQSDRKLSDAIKALGTGR